jgi:hypothetical protein
MGMFGARFAVFVRRARVLPSPCHATRNFCSSGFHRRHHLVVPLWFIELVRVGSMRKPNVDFINWFCHVTVLHGYH